MFELPNKSMYYIHGGIEACKPNKHTGPEFRTFYSMHYVLHGAGFYKFRNKTYHIKAGQSFLLFPFEKIEYYPDPENPWEYTWVCFAGDIAEKTISYTGFTADNPVSPILPRKEFLDNYKALSNIPQTLAENYRIIGTLYHLLADYIKLYPNENDSEAENKIMTKANLYIAKNYSRCDLSISDIAKDLFISRSYLYKIFYTKYNLSPIQYLTKYRVENARNMLLSTKESVKNIAYSVGYSNPIYFSKVFKQLIGCSPQEYRDDHKN